MLSRSFYQEAVINAFTVIRRPTSYARFTSYCYVSASAVTAVEIVVTTGVIINSVQLRTMRLQHNLSKNLLIRIDG